MKKLFLLFAALIVTLSQTVAQKAKKTTEEKQAREAKTDSTETRSEKQKNFWKKVGENERDFWTGEHDRRVKAKEEKDKKAGKTSKDTTVEKQRREPPPPPKPPNPFKKKKKDKEKEETTE